MKIYQMRLTACSIDCVIVRLVEIMSIYQTKRPSSDWKRLSAWPWPRGASGNGKWTRASATVVWQLTRRGGVKSSEVKPLDIWVVTEQLLPRECPSLLAKAISINVPSPFCRSRHHCAVVPAQSMVCCKLQMMPNIGLARRDKRTSMTEPHYIMFIHQVQYTLFS